MVGAGCAAVLVLLADCGKEEPKQPASAPSAPAPTQAVAPVPAPSAQDQAKPGQAGELNATEKMLMPLAQKEGSVTIINPRFHR
jgi:hypothetical protein